MLGEFCFPIWKMTFFADVIASYAKLNAIYFSF